MASETIWVLVPIFGMALVFGMTWVITNIFVQRTRARAQPDASYRALAEEAIQSQKELLAEVRRMTTSLREVERLLGEV